MSGATVQNAQDSATAGATSIAVTLGAAVTAGNAVVAFVQFTGGSAVSATMGNGTDTLTLQGSIVNDSGTRTARYAKVNCTGGGSATFTWSNSTSLTNRCLWVIECSGIDTASGVVGGSNPAAGTPGSGTDAITTGAVANSSGLTAFHIGIGIDSPNDTITIASGTGMTQIGTAGWTLGSAFAGALVEYVTGVAASANSALTWTGGYGGHTYKAASIMLKESAGGGGSSATALPGVGAVTINGLAATVNSITSITIKEVFINEAGSPVSNRTGMSLLIWYAGNPIGAPDLSYSALTTDAAGTASWNIALGGLTYNQTIFYVATDGGSSLSAYTCARMIPTYA